jgi:hypothetical protein
MRKKPFAVADTPHWDGDIFSRATSFESRGIFFGFR